MYVKSNQNNDCIWGDFGYVKDHLFIISFDTMIRVGAHTSIAWGIHLALERSHDIGGNTLQIFAKSPRGRSIPTYTEEDYKKVTEYREKYQQVGGLIHANYLANLSKPFDECQNDIRSILNDFEVWHHTWFEAVNIHVGKGKGFDDVKSAYTNMAKNVEYIISQNQKNGYSPLFLFEITAGQGSELGYLVDDLAVFYQWYLKDFPLAFCFDTAHAWGGGNDLRQWDKIADVRWEKIGVDKLYSFHLNDSKAILWSRLDRHAPLWRWAIGMPALAQIITWATKHNKPLFLETSEPDLWPQEIEAIKRIASGNTDWIKDFHDEHSGTHMLKKFQWEQGSLF